MLDHSMKERHRVIKEYKQWLWKAYNNDFIIKSLLEEIQVLSSNGCVYLGCYCTPLPCHGEVIKCFIEDRL